jgi:hypothetical protein
MRALSVQQPWAWAILHAGKNIENRKWRLPKGMEGERIILHAGKKIDKEGLARLDRLFEEGVLKERCPAAADLPKSAFLGEVTVVGCAHLSEIEDPGPWHKGPYCFGLSEPEEYVTPIPARGFLSFFDPDKARI